VTATRKIGLLFGMKYSKHKSLPDVGCIPFTIASLGQICTCSWLYTHMKTKQKH